MAQGAALTPEETQRGLRLGIAEGAFAYATFTLTSGAVLGAFVIAMGMGPLEFGLFTSMPFLAQLIQIPNLALLRRFPQRRTLTVVFATAGRLALLGVAAALLFVPEQRLLAALLVCFTLWSVFSALAGGAWLWWMRDLVPRDRLGSYFGHRASVLVACSAPVLIGAGLFLDWFSLRGAEADPRSAFAVLFVVAALSGLASSVLLSRMPHAPPTGEAGPAPLRRTLAAPFVDANYRRLLQWLGIWWFASTFTVPFFSVFLLAEVGLPVSVITALLVLGIVANVVFLGLWGRLSDRMGNKPVLAVCVPVLGTGLLLVGFVPVLPFALAVVVVIVVQVFLAIAAAGADLTAWNLSFKLSAGPAAPSYLAATSLVRALATGAGPLAAGLAAAALAQGDFRIAVHIGAGPGLGIYSVTPLTALFLFGAALVLFSSPFLARVREEGEAPASALLNALRTEAASESLLPGVRHFAVATTGAVRVVVEAQDRAQASLDSGIEAYLEGLERTSKTFGASPPPPGQT